MTVDSDDTARKIDALYASLAVIDSVAPVVPGIVDRLRAMRVIHADAAGVTTGIKDAAGRIVAMEKEIKEWKEALARVEIGLKDAAGRVGTAVQKVEEMVTGLEGRVKNLET